MKAKQFTIEPVQACQLAAALPEFGRHADVQRLFGLKRGTLYNLLHDKKIRGVLLRVRGQKSGVRLFDLDSVRRFILSEMKDNEDSFDPIAVKEKSAVAVTGHGSP